MPGEYPQPRARTHQDGPLNGVSGQILQTPEIGTTGNDTMAGALSAARVVTTFGGDNSGTVVFDFGSGNAFTLSGVASLTGIEADPVIVCAALPDHPPR